MMMMTMTMMTMMMMSRIWIWWGVCGCSREKQFHVSPTDKLGGKGVSWSYGNHGDDDAHIWSWQCTVMIMTVVILIIMFQLGGSKFETISWMKMVLFGTNDPNVGGLGRVVPKILGSLGHIWPLYQVKSRFHCPKSQISQNLWGGWVGPQVWVIYPK